MSENSAGRELRLDGICEGNGLCVLAAPDLVALEDHDEFVRVLVQHPSAEQLPQAQRAVDACPLRALALSPEADADLGAGKLPRRGCGGYPAWAVSSPVSGSIGWRVTL
jgi:ferredoxin